MFWIDFHYTSQTKKDSHFPTAVGTHLEIEFFGEQVGAMVGQSPL
jgi:hypothetical protein